MWPLLGHGGCIAGLVAGWAPGSSSLEPKWEPRGGRCTAGAAAATRPGAGHPSRAPGAQPARPRVDAAR
eukprot:1596764-Lingulodinium_polyedra.AAC.1